MKATNFYYFILIIPSLVFSQNTEKKANLEISVYDSNKGGKLVQFADVEIYRDVVRTSSTKKSGRVYFQGILPGKYEIIVRKHGYKYFHDLIQVRPSTEDHKVEVERVVLFPIPTDFFSIGGKVLNKRGNFVENAEINLLISGGVSQDQKSDQFGNFQFLFSQKNQPVSNFLNKNYQISIRKEGYKSYGITQKIDKKDSWLNNLILRKEAIPFFRRKSTKLGAFFVGSCLLGAGLGLELKAQDIYDIYKKNENPNSEVFNEMSRDEHYRVANNKHRLGLGLGIVGILVGTSGIFMKSYRSEEPESNLSVQGGKSGVILQYRF